MRFFFTFLLFLPLILAGQSTVFSEQQELFELASDHVGVRQPMMPVIEENTLQYFLGFTGGDLTKYTKNSTNEYEKEIIPSGSSSYAGAILAYEDIDKDGVKDLITNRDLFRGVDNSFIEFNFSDISINPRGLGDFDGDGLLDIIAVREEPFGKSELYFLKNKGNFQFEEIVIENVFERYHTFAFGDIDNDGDIDFVVTDRTQANISVRLYLNNGSGSFSMTERGVNSFDCCYSNNVELFDFDSDGDLDLVLASNDRGVYIFENTDNFQTLTPKNDFRTNSIRNPLMVKAFDFNNDNFTDLVVLRQTQDNFFLEYFEAQDQYSFRAPRRLMTLQNRVLEYSVDGTEITRNLSLVDLNNDGKMDITFTSGEEKKQYAVINNTVISSTQDLFEENIRISPNPVLDRISVNFGEGAKVQIFSQLGILEMEHICTENENNIDVGSLNSGIYFLKATTKNNLVKSAKFVKVNR